MSSRLLSFVAVVVFAMTSSAALACSSSGLDKMTGTKGSSSTASTSSTLDQRGG
jgi:hypothetical protein